MDDAEMRSPPGDSTIFFGRDAVDGDLLPRSHECSKGRLLLPLLALIDQRQPTALLG